MRRAKKGQQKVPILKQTTLLCPSRCNFSMVPAYTSIYEDTEKRQMASSIHRQTSERQTSETTNIGTTNVGKFKPQNDKRRKITQFYIYLKMPLLLKHRSPINSVKFCRINFVLV